MKATTRDTIIYSVVVFSMTVLGWWHAKGDFAGANLLMQLYVGVPAAVTSLLHDLFKFEPEEFLLVFMPILAALNLVIFIPTLLLRKFKEPMNFMLTQGGVLIAYMVISFPISAMIVYL